MTPGKLYFTSVHASAYNPDFRTPGDTHSITIPKHTQVMYVGPFILEEEDEFAAAKEKGWYHIDRDRWAVVLYEERLWLVNKVWLFPTAP